MKEKSKFKQNKYEQIDYEDEREFIIGSIILYEGKVCNAKLGDGEIGNKAELKKAQEFLKEVEKLEWLRNTDSV